MKKIFCLLLLVGCSAEVIEPLPEPEPTYLPEVIPLPQKPPPPQEHPCDVVKEYTVYGRVIKIPVWCNPEPFIYKGYPAPYDK